MGHFKNFLESSSINGLNHISASRQKCVRLFWIIVVISGLTGAAILIHFSFKSWEESPIKTTIETRPITEITFPKVTVCPPKKTFTDLNHDLMMTENMTLHNKSRNELKDYAMELLFENLYDTIMANWSKLEDKDKYYNWYHGYNQIYLPYYSSRYGYATFVFTNAPSGTISTQHFGNKFDAEKVEPFCYYVFNVYPPDNGIRGNPNVTLHFEIEKISMKDFSSGNEKLYVTSGGYIEANINSFDKKYNNPSKEEYTMSLQRKVTVHDVKKQKLNLMPGFQFKWYYSGMDVVPIDKYYNDPYNKITNTFVRNRPIICDLFIYLFKLCKLFLISFNHHPHFMYIKTYSARFANILKLSNLDTEEIWKIVKRIKSTTSIDIGCGKNNKHPNVDEVLYSDDVQMSQVTAIEQEINIASTDQKFENMTKEDFKAAAEMFIYLNTCVFKSKSWFLFYKDMLQNDNPDNIILTLNRMTKAQSGKNEELKIIAQKLLKRANNIFSCARSCFVLFFQNYE